MNEKNNDISQLAKATLKDDVNFLALGEQNINAKIINTKIKINEDFKKTYGALKSQKGGTIRTVVIANAEKIKNIFENMRKQSENNLKNMRKQKKNDFENYGREQI